MRREIEKYKESRIRLETEIIDLNKHIDELCNHKEMNEINSLKLKDLYYKGVIDEEGQLK